MAQTSTGRTVMCQGRIVFTIGDLFKGRIKTEFGSQTPKLNAKGEQMTEYGFGLAIPKDVLNQTGEGQPGHIWAAIHEEAYQIYPSRQVPPSFGWKYKDGDGVDHNGQPFAQREGYAGHLVFALSTTIPIKFFRYENGQNILINEGIKCGDYVNVQLTIKAHGAIGQGKPGLYLNPNAVQFLGYGKEIINTPSGDQIFGHSAPPVPAGASTTPIAPSGQIIPSEQSQPGMGQPMAPQGMAAPQTPSQPQAPPVTPEPHWGVLPENQQQQAPQAPQQPTPAMPASGGQGYQQAYQQPSQPQAPQGFPQQPGFPAPGQGQ